jgi:pyruvate dehydrogenase E2 component (dihydrolipoamide acetyltransferase)
MIEFRMPSLGADMEAGTLCEWLVKPGDTVKRGDIVATVDTQKGLIDIEVFEEGRIEKLLIKEDEKVPVGTVMALIDDGKGTPVSATISAPVTSETITPVVEKKTEMEMPHRIKASPLAKTIAAEKGVDLSTITGTGEEGAITKEDVLKAVAERTSPAEEKKGTSSESIRMAVAAAMSKSNREIPHYYLETKVDMSKTLSWLTAANLQRSVKERLLPVVLYMKAAAKALAETPDLNGHWVNGFLAKKEIIMGFVVSLRTGGVMIPAIHGVGAKTIDEIMASLNDVIPRARALKLRSSDLSETTITITSLGEGSVESVYGVIYPPQVAIVGFGSISEQPWAESGMLDVRPVMNVTLAADHRATDGATGSRFLTALKNHLQKPELL